MMDESWMTSELLTERCWMKTKQKQTLASRNKADKQDETNQGQTVAKSRGCRYFLPQEVICWLSFKRIPRIDLEGRFSLPQWLLLNSVLAQAEHWCFGLVSFPIVDVF